MIGPVRLALVVTVPAVRFAAVPVAFVSTTADGVPRFGVVNAGETSGALPLTVEAVVVLSVLYFDFVNAFAPRVESATCCDVEAFPERADAVAELSVAYFDFVRAFAAVVESD